MDVKTSFVDLNSNLGFLRARKQREKPTRERHATNVNDTETNKVSGFGCTAVRCDFGRCDACARARQGRVVGFIEIDDAIDDASSPFPGGACIASPGNGATR